MEEHCRMVLQMHHRARAALCDEKNRKSIAHMSPQKGIRPFTELATSEVPAYFQAWIDDGLKAFEIAGLDPCDEETRKLSDVIHSNELRHLRKLLASCLYIQSCEKKNSAEQWAFDIARSELLGLKAENLAQQTSQASFILPLSTYYSLRLGKYAVRRK